MDQVLINQKHCSRCHKIKDIEMFTRNRARGDGREAYCKTCKKIFYKETYSSFKNSTLPKVATEE